MTDMPRERDCAIAKMEEIVDQAVNSGADAVTFEFAKEGGLEVLFVFGNIGAGDILDDKPLGAELMRLIHNQAGLKNKSSSVLHWQSHGQKLAIGVEDYDSFGETAYTLTFAQGRR